MRALKLLVAILILGVMTIAGAAAGKDVRATWTPPTEGSPAVGYELEVYTNGDMAFSVQIPDTTYLLTGIEMFTVYTARVRAFDAQDRFGPWTPMSAPYIWDDGAPGSCGIPEWMVTKLAPSN